MRAPSTLLLGPPGAGKTYSLSTFTEAGIKLAVIFTDPGGEESLIDAYEAKNLSMDNVHWRYVAPVGASWDALLDMSSKIQSMGYDDLTKIKSGIAKAKYSQFTTLLATLANFKCERTGKELGPVDALSPEYAVAIDSLSGINVMAFDMTVGAKPAAHQGEWGVAMNAEEKLIYKLTSDLDCFFVLTAHIEREMDEAVGRTQLMASALGRKLAPKIPRTFSDVVLARKEGATFSWSTTSPGVDLKNRALPLSDNLQPSFVQIVERWRAREAKATAA